MCPLFRAGDTAADGSTAVVTRDEVESLRGFDEARSGLHLDERHVVLFGEVSVTFRAVCRDILAALKGDASRGSYVTPVNSDGWESKVCGLSATGSVVRKSPIFVMTRDCVSRTTTKPLLVPARGFELPDCLPTVGVTKTRRVLFAHQKSPISGDVVGLLFYEANTESTANFPRTFTQPTRWNVSLWYTVKVDDDGRCIPALKREVLAPCTAVHNSRVATTVQRPPQTHSSRERW